MKINHLLSASILLSILMCLATSSCKSERRTQQKHSKQIRTTTTEVTNLLLKKYSFSQPHLGTTVNIVFYTDKAKQAAELSQQCFKKIRDLNAIFSDYLEDSELTKLCEKPITQAHQVSKHLFTVISHAQNISKQTHGAFDITLGKQTKRWREQKINEPNKNEQQVSYQDLKLDAQQQTITLLKPLKIDLGGIAKGYIADQTMLILSNAGLKRAAVIIGGETALADAPPNKKGWKIGIENPAKQIIGTLTLKNTCLSTSGDSYQFFNQDGKRKSHLIDPVTKNSKTNRLNVTTLASSAMQADGWATALRILPIEKSLPLAEQQAELQALFLPFQENTQKTKNFPKITN